MTTKKPNKNILVSVDGGESRQTRRGKQTAAAAAAAAAGRRLGSKQVLISEQECAARRCKGIVRLSETRSTIQLMSGGR